MPELLLELQTEEIPARMQRPAAEALRLAATQKFASSGLAVETVKTYVTPRRLTLVVDGLPAAQDDVVEERRGPRVGAPEAALQGFLKSTNLATIDQCQQRDTGKGIFYFAVIKVAGRATVDVLPELLRSLILGLSWPKSMRFPEATFRWVRPLRRVVSLFDGIVVPIDLDSIPVGDETIGHRFLSSGLIKVADFADYSRKLAQASVMLDHGERKARLRAALGDITAVAGLRWRTDEELLDEVAGLIEWPVPRLGRIEPDFMSLPPEVLTTSMRTHQKYFAVENAAGVLAPNFVVVGNNETRDGGRQMVAGNEKVLRARLSDAQFFWDQDRRQTLDSRVGKLAERVFHARLGTMYDKVQRMTALAEVLVPFVPGADLVAAHRAVLLTKADLSSAMVGEFPELQGIMGRYLALNDGEMAIVADAIARHYAPQGASDSAPSEPVAVIAALADKIDTLVGFFAIDEKPTGSKDPYALRRAGLGIIRIILENGLRLPLRKVFTEVLRLICPQLMEYGGLPAGRHSLATDRQTQIIDGLLEFLADRLKVALREEGLRHDLISAVFALGGEDDLVRLVARTRALQTLIVSEDGGNLLTAYRRAFRIVQIEEKKDGASFSATPDPLVIELPEEQALVALLARIEPESKLLLAREDYAGAMALLAGLRRPVDAFFDGVTVNTENVALRQNRLRILSQIWKTLNKVADFSKIEG